MRIKALAAGLLLAWATTSFAQSAAPSPQVFKFEMHGFASGSVFMQDGVLISGQGQIGYLPAAAQPKQDVLMFGADARQSRFNWSVTGPMVFGGATPKGVLEIDWMGNFGSGNNGEVHLYPRLRVAYAELNWGAHRLVFGQNYDMTAAMGPVTLAHLGAPYLLVAGNMGFRRPGVFGYHTFGDLKSKDSMKVEFGWEVGRAAWTDQGAFQRINIAGTGQTASFTNVGNGAGANGCQGLTGYIAPASSASALPPGAIAGICAGEASGLPAVQARLSLTKGANFSAFVAGHYQRVDRSGYGVQDSSTNRPPFNDIDVIGGNAGVKGVAGPITLSVAGYVGKNLSPLYGGMGTIFYPAGGDVHEYGVWGQAGFNLTKEFSAWGFIGMDRINDDDMPGSGFLVNRNVTANGLLQYRDGGYAIGLEWTHMRANYTRAGGGTAATVPNEGVQIVNQVALTGNYYF